MVSLSASGDLPQVDDQQIQTPSTYKGPGCDGWMNGPLYSSVEVLIPAAFSDPSGLSATQPLWVGHVERALPREYRILLLASLLLVAMPGAPSSVLAPSSKARSP